MAQQPQQKKSRFGCLRIIGILFVLSIICGGGVYFWQNQLFNDFHQKYLNGDCTSVAELYDQLIISDEAKEAQALYEYNGCQLLLTAQTNVQSRDFNQAFSNLLAIQRDYFDTTLATRSADRINELVSDPAPIIGDANFCMNLDRFDVNEALDSLRTFIADNWFSCAETLRDAEAGLDNCSDCTASQKAALHYGALITYIEDYSKKYPLDGQEADLDNLMAEVMSRQAEFAGAGEISLPPGREIGGSDAVLIIQNAAPNALRIALTGGGSNASVVESIETCEDCRAFTTSPSECPESDIVTTITVPAGNYSVIVNTIGGGVVTPFIGTWELEAGTEYFQCFFIVSR